MRSLWKEQAATFRPLLCFAILFVVPSAEHWEISVMPHSGGYHRESLLSFLQAHGVACETYEHPVVMTAEEQAEQIGHLDGGFSKNLFLKDKKNRLYLVSALSSTRVDLKALSGRLGLGKGGLRMAGEESLQGVLQVPLGCVTPFALLNLSARYVSLILDVGFQKQSRMFFHPLTNDASTALTTENLDKFLKAIGREPSYVDLEAAAVVNRDQPPDLAYLVPTEAHNDLETPRGSTGLQVPAVAAVAKQSPSISAEKSKSVVSKAKDLARVDIDNVLNSVLDHAVAAAVAEIASLTSKEEKELVVAETIDASIRRRLRPDLESLLMMFKNTMYAEGFKSAVNGRSSRQ